MTVDKDREEAILKILREEYGITTEEELDKAIKEQGWLNLAPFLCSPASAPSQSPDRTPDSCPRRCETHSPGIQLSPPESPPCR